MKNSKIISAGMYINQHDAQKNLVISHTTAGRIGLHQMQYTACKRSLLILD